MNAAARLRAGRQAALLFIGGGLITVLNAPMGAESHGLALGSVGVAAFLIGVCALAVPWGRWPARTSLVTLIPPAFVLIVIANAYGHASPYTYALYYILVFVWIGLTQPRLTALALAPLAALAYVFPVLIGQPRPGLVVSLTDALPVCLLVGETISWVMERLAKAQQEGASRVANLEALVGAGAALECNTDPSHLPDEVARVAGALFDSDEVAVLVGRDEAMTVVGRKGTDDFASLQTQPVSAICARAEPEYLAEEHTLVVPLRASLRTIGALVVRVEAEPDEFLVGLARVFSSQAGLALERHHAVGRLQGTEVRDPATGLGTRAHADALISGLEPDDVVLAMTITGARQAEAAFLLGPFLERELRTYDSAAQHDEGVIVILRNAGGAAEAATRRIGATWARSHPGVPLLLGMAVHRPPSFPDDTVAAARAAMTQISGVRPAPPWDVANWAV